jgi:ribosome assembly protein 4
MATLLPPPSKRQKLAQAEKAREQQEIQSIPTDLGSVRVQFYDQATGNATGPAVSVPVADANIKNLETLLNTLQGNVRDFLNRIVLLRRTNWLTFFLCTGRR